MQSKAILVGNSDGIGKAVTNRLLKQGWDVIGISRSESSLKHEKYQHHVCDVVSVQYHGILDATVQTKPVDLCIYFAGIGVFLDPLDMSGEANVIDVNLTSMVKTAAAVVPGMIERGQGHFIGVSSVADELISAEAPSYHASKAGFTNYLRGLALALKPKGVYVTNVRYGFVDTKLAKGDIKPFMMTTEKAANHMQYCIDKKPVNYTAPKVVIPLIKFRRLMMSLGAR